MHHETWAGLDVRLTGGHDGKGGGKGPVVVLLHGFGAPGDDLAVLGRLLSVPQETRFVFPVGPISLSLGFGESRAWWRLDMERLVRERSLGQWESLTREVPVGLGDARQRLACLLEDIQCRLGVPPDGIVIGGFSQGAMLACDLAWRTEPRFAGLAILSGSLIARDEWEPLLPRHKGLRVFQSHGTEDPLLSCAVARQFREILTHSGLEVDWMEFPGGHGIPIQVLERLGRFLKAVLF